MMRDYKFCLGNRLIENTLRKLNECRFAKQQSIKSLTNAGTAITVQEMIKRLKRRHDQQTELQAQRLDEAAAERQRGRKRQLEMQEDEAAAEQQRRQKRRLETQEDDPLDNIMSEYSEEMPDTDLPDDIPPATEETIRSEWSTLIGRDV